MQARRLTVRAEADDWRAGYREVALTATLSSTPLYRRLGYKAWARMVLCLPAATRAQG